MLGKYCRTRQLKQDNCSHWSIDWETGKQSRCESIVWCMCMKHHIVVTIHLLFCFFLHRWVVRFSRSAFPLLSYNYSILYWISLYFNVCELFTYNERVNASEGCTEDDGNGDGGEGGGGSGGNDERIMLRAARVPSLKNATIFLYSIWLSTTMMETHYSLNWHFAFIVLFSVSRINNMGLALYTIYRHTSNARFFSHAMLFASIVFVFVR